MADPILWTFAASDGYRSHYRHYPPGGRLRARVVYLHGIQSHAGWYDGSCQHLAAAGYDVFFLDRRGSGLNTENRGDTPSFRRLIKDAGEFTQMLRLPGLPVFIVAVSWGGKVAAGVAARFPRAIDGMALLAPGFCPQIQPTRSEKARILAAGLASPTQMFPIPLSDPTLFTDNVERQRFIEADPLSLRVASARFLLESGKFDFYLRRTVKRVACPVLLMLAGKDRIIDNEQTRRYVARFGSRDATVIEYPAAHHTLEFEPEPRLIFSDLTDWLDHRAKA